MAWALDCRSRCAVPRPRCRPTDASYPAHADHPRSAIWSYMILILTGVRDPALCRDRSPSGTAAICHHPQTHEYLPLTPTPDRWLSDLCAWHFAQ